MASRKSEEQSILTRTSLVCKCLLRSEKSLLALAVRIGQLGKRSFRGVWEEEAQLQHNKIESAFY